MRASGMLVATALWLGFGGSATGDGPAQATELVVHEWGTFTSVVGGSGIALEWRPLSVESDLPGFVYKLRADGIAGRAGGRSDGTTTPASRPVGPKRSRSGDDPTPEPKNYKKVRRSRVRMETPVLYFYSDRPMTCDVDVRFPKGVITEWYPQASRSSAGIRWPRVQVVPEAPRRFPQEPERSHYYPARAVDASPVVVDGRAGPQREQFLFYRGVGSFDLPLRVMPDGAHLQLTPRTERIEAAIVFERRGDRTSWTTIRDLRGPRRVLRPTLPRPLAPLLAELTDLLVGQGLHRREAAAMVATWRDTWFEDGLRVLYLVPRSVTDRVLPIRIAPRPRSLVRVLVGRTEVLSADRRASILRAAADLGDAAWSKRQAAAKTLERYGPFAEPVLRALMQETRDPEIRRRLQRLLELPTPRRASGAASR